MNRLLVTALMIFALFALVACGGNDVPTAGGETQDRGNQATTTTPEPADTSEQGRGNTWVDIYINVPEEYYTLGDVFVFQDLFEISIGAEARLVTIAPICPDTQSGPYQVLSTAIGRDVLQIPITITNISDEVLVNASGTHFSHQVIIPTSPISGSIGSWSERQVLFMASNRPENSPTGETEWIPHEFQPGETIPFHVPLRYEGDGFYQIDIWYVDGATLGFHITRP